MADWSTSVSNTYLQKKSEVIIGLTGRTGSGCTTTANILKTEEFCNLDLKLPTSHKYSTTDDRKYEIVYNFLLHGMWKPFTVIEGSSIIFSFVLEQGYKNFMDFIEQFRNISKNNNIRIGAFYELIGVLQGIKHLFDNNTEYCIESITDTILEDETAVENLYNIFIIELPKLKREFQSAIKEFSCHREFVNKLAQTKFVKSKLYTFLFQQIGNNIRCSGNPYINSFSEVNFFDVAKRMNALIKIIRAHNKFKNEKNTRICIDAIRNSYEAFYFKDLYSSFYLISVNTEDEFRKSRLGDLDDDELESLDEIEYAQNFDKEYEGFYHQNLQDCLAISDIHIYNSQIKDKKLFELTEQVAKYVCLMLHPGLIAPTHIERCMQIAFIARLNSGCLSRQVGAVVTGYDYSIKAVGWNDIPEGQVPCNLRSVQNFCKNKDKETFSEFELENKEFQDIMDTLNKSIENCSCSSRYFSYCFKDIYNGLNRKENQVYTRSLHAEENAFLQIAKNGGQGVKDGKLFTTASPCELCAKKAYQLGIKEIIYIDPYPGISIQHILTFGTSNNPHMILFHGAIGSAYINLYSQRMSTKDELKLISGIDNKKTALELKSGLLPEPKTNDIKYIRRESRITFQTRTKIIENESASIEVTSDSLCSINRKVYWTGSSFDKYQVTNCQCHGGWSFEYIPVNESLFTGTVRFEEIQKKGDIIHLDTQISVKDAQRIMMPLYAQMIVNKTEFLVLEIQAEKGLLTGVQCVEYADLKMTPNFEVQRSEPICYIENGMEVFKYQIDKPNLLYSYCIEWNFS